METEVRYPSSQADGVNGRDEWRFLVAGEEEDVNVNGSALQKPLEIRSPHRETSTRTRLYGSRHKPTYTGPAGTLHQTEHPPVHEAISTARIMAKLDRGIARVLRVQPKPLMPREAAATSSSQPFQTPIFVSALHLALRRPADGAPAPRGCHQPLGLALSRAPRSASS